MSYYTSYSLFAHPVSDDETAQKIADELYACGALDTALDSSYILADGNVKFDPYDPVKWYDHDEDMRAVSREFPDIHFELHGKGEDNDDIWTQHFVNGKAQLCMAEIVIPPFDPEKLE